MKNFDVLCFVYMFCYSLYVSLVSLNNIHWNQGTVNVRLLYLKQPICDNIWQLCAFYDTNMKFGGTHLDLIITKIFEYRAHQIQISHLKANFLRWLP